MMQLVWGPALALLFYLAGYPEAAQITIGAEIVAMLLSFIEVHVSSTVGQNVGSIFVGISAIIFGYILVMQFGPE